MKMLAFLLVASAAFAQSGQPVVANTQFQTRAFAGNLESQIQASSPTWFGYAIKTMRGDHQNCCWNGNVQCGCSLEGKGAVTVGGTTSSGPVQLEGSDTLAVLFRVANNTVEKIQAYSLSCSLDAGGLPFIWVTGVPASASLPYLQKLARTGA